MKYLSSAELITPPKKLEVKNGDLKQVANDSYRSYNNEWSFQRDSFLGGNFFLNQNYIKRYAREDASRWKSRITRAHYFNIVELAVNSYKSTVYSVPVDRSDVKPDLDLKTFMKDVDLKGHDIDEFMKNVYMWTTVFGYTGILFDAPQIIVEPGREPTLLDQREQGVRPYASIIFPHEILDHQFTMGRPKNNTSFEAILIKIDDVPTPNPKRTGEELRAQGMKLITKNYIAIYDKKGTLVQTFENLSNIIPFFVVGDLEIEFPVHVSPLRDLFKKSRSILELSMTLDEMLYYNGDPLLAVSSAEILDDIHKGESSILPLGPQENAEFLVLPHEAVTNVQARLDELKKECRMLILKITTEQKKSNQIEGADSKLLDRKEMTEFMRTQSDFMEDAENNLFKFYNQFIRSNAKNPEIIYSREYNLESVEKQIAGITKSIGEIPVHSDTLVKEREKQYANALLIGKIPGDTLEKIHKEIDAADVTDITDIDAMIGRVNDAVKDSESRKDPNLDAEDKPDAKRILENKSGEENG